MANRAIEVHRTATTDDAWDGARNAARLAASGGADSRSACAWVDTETGGKFLHHELDDTGKAGPASVRGCIAAIAALNARGGAGIPSEDRDGVYRHLKAHLDDAGVQAPGLKRSAELGAPERRYIGAAELRIEDGAEDKEPVIHGYAARFNVLSEPLGFFQTFREKIRAGAFKKTITESDVRCLYNHDPNYVLGRTRSRTLELEEDDLGLKYRNTPPDAEWARGLVVTIRRGDVDQSSFGFETIRDEWEFNHETKEVTRTLVEVKLFDVSPVTFPAYLQTSVGVRTLEGLGVRVDQFANVFARARAGESLDAESRAILDSVSQALASIPAAPAAREAVHPAGDQDLDASPRLSLLRRRLELADRS